MKIKKPRLIQNINAVSHPLEFVMAVGILLISFCIIFSAVSQVFSPYERDDFSLRAKAMMISERLLKDTGLTTNGESEWECDVQNLSYLGLASYILVNDTWYITWPSHQSSPRAETLTKSVEHKQNCTFLNTVDNLTFTTYHYKNITDYVMREKTVISNRIDYKTLDSDKLDALNYVQYADAKIALGLENRYDFNIAVTTSDDVELLRYGKPYGNETVVGSFIRNVKVYLSHTTTYTEAQLSVHVF